MFFSTINRNPKAYLAVVGTEYVLGMLPKGTPRLCEIHQTVRVGAVGYNRAWNRSSSA